MANPTEKGDDRCPQQAPLPRLRHGDERQVVVGTGERMDEADTGGSAS